MKRITLKEVFLLLSIFIISSNYGIAQEGEDGSDPNNQDYVVIDHQKRKSEINTLLGDDITHGGYIGLMLNVGENAGAETINLGGRLGWIWNHSFAIGLMGKAFGNLENNEIMNVPDSITTTSLYGGYAGLFFEPIIMPKSPVHVSFPVGIGAGLAGYSSETRHKDISVFEFSEVNENDGFLVVEPGVEVEFNVVSFFRIALNASYRYTYDFYMTEIDKNSLNGFNFGTTFKFGFF